MIHSTRFSTNMIVYLMVGYLLQLGGIHGAPGKHALCRRAVDTPPAAAATDAANAVTAATDSAASTASDGGLLSSVSSTAMDFGSEATKSVEEMLKAGSRVNLAVLSLFDKLLGAVSLTVAKGSDYVASGAETVDGLLNGLPVVGVVTSGAKNLATGVSSTFNEISATGRKSRRKMFDQLREKLNNSNGAAAATAAADPTANNAAAATATADTA
ncbi:uncharacterized protein LOC112688668 [Sipha flava]|uniref:Uncharacterized protein LOC112688668 n=1 Tax=Sipha flava TaxID=143950 RepID=A0A2S2R9A0_9HEMI|nr:uncharacterized protein LOC112688668 [Sipha flava]